MSDVILVEDEAGLRESLVEGLSRAFPEVRFAAYGSVEEAEGPVDDAPPRVIISDIRLPGRNGFEFLEAVKRKHPQIRFILITAHASFGSPENARNQRAFSLLRKPFPLRELVETLEAALKAPFSGMIEGFSLIEFLQLINLSRKTVAVVIRHGDNVGQLFFEDGELVHAEVDDQVGFDAFRTLMAWPGGDFSTVSTGVEGGQRSIRMPFQHVALEVFRLQDEERRDADLAAKGEPAPAEPAPTPAAPPADATGARAQPTPGGFTAEDLGQLAMIEGTLFAALFDIDARESLGAEGSWHARQEEAVAHIMDLVRAKSASMAGHDELEELLFTFQDSYHVIHRVGEGSRYLLVVFDRDKTNLAMAQHLLRSLVSRR